MRILNSYEVSSMIDEIITCIFNPKLVKLDSNNKEIKQEYLKEEEW